MVNFRGTMLVQHLGQTKQQLSRYFSHTFSHAAEVTGSLQQKRRLDDSTYECAAKVKVWSNAWKMQKYLLVYSVLVPHRSPVYFNKPDLAVLFPFKLIKLSNPNQA